MYIYVGNLLCFSTSDSPQAKRDVVSPIIDFVCQLHHEYPNDLRLRELENFRKIWKLSYETAQYPVSPVKFNIFQ